MPLDQAMRRAKVLDYDLQRQVAPQMSLLKPLPSLYYPQFINANQEERADNVVPGESKLAHLEHIRKDIRDFKAANGLDQVVVLWTANTERYSEVTAGVHDTKENLLKAIRDDHFEVSPSTIFAVAAILEGVPYINGAPQNTFVPGCIELAEHHKSFIGGDDFKSGQTKVRFSLLARRTSLLTPCLRRSSPSSPISSSALVSSPSRSRRTTTSATTTARTYRLPPSSAPRRSPRPRSSTTWSRATVSSTSPSLPLRAPPRATRATRLSTPITSCVPLPPSPSH